MTSTTPDVHSAGQLVRATALAAAVAAVVLAVAVLPAEYGLDPTGLGARLGLLRPVTAIEASGAAAMSAEDATAAPLGQVVTRHEQPFRTEETSITLGWREGGEIKATMRRGQRLVFSWQAQGGAVDVDMHGEAVNAPRGEYTSYWKADQIGSGHGTFEAPFDGTHGWFWQNFGQEPVTITVRASGYFDSLGRP